MTAGDVIRADASHLDSVTDLLSQALGTLDVARWIVADPDVRARVFPPVTRIYVEHALEYGSVDLTADGHAVVVYYMDADVPPPDDFEARVRAAAGPHADRFLAFSDLLDAHHPHDVPPHAYIAMIGRRPGFDSQGISYIVRNHVLERFDDAGVPAYFEASNDRLRKNFLRRGARDIGEPFHLPDGGPVMYPMWRDPMSPFRP